jgi:hypothetical protein
MQHSRDSRVAVIAKRGRPSAWHRAGLFPLILLVLLVTVTPASAADLKGTIFNRTTRKPGIGDEVVLLSFSKEGMNETARALADSRGHFSLPLADQQATHVVRVIHQGVTYHKVIAPGGKPLVIEVYDAATQLEGVTAVMDVQRFEATGDTLEVKQLVTMRNESKPPRTLLSDRPFEIHLPADAQVESGLIQIGSGQPLKQKPIRDEQKGHYYFSSPIRPGDTRFAIVYRLPYKGAALIEPRIRNAQERFVVMLPQSMKFEPAAVGVFRPMPGTSPDNVQGTAPVSVDQAISFRISGTGTLEELEGHRRQAQLNQGEKKPTPGGGLGPPIEAPDPLHDQRWLILSGLSLILAYGFVRVLRRPVLAEAIELKTRDTRDYRKPNRGRRKL